MKRNIPLLILTIVIAIASILIAVPSFNIQLSDNTYAINGLDPSDLGLNFVNQEFSFQPSVDLQGGSLVTLGVDLTSTDNASKEAELNKIKSIIYFRLRNAKIDNFTLNVVSDSLGNKSKILIKAPSTVNETIMNLLLAPSNLSVWVEDPNATDNVQTGTYAELLKQIFGDRKMLSITNSDVTSVSLVSDSRCYFMEKTSPKNWCIKVTFSDDAMAEFATALRAVPYTNLPVVVALDYSPVGVQAAGQEYLNPSEVGRDILMYPLFEDEKLLTSIIASMIGSEPLNSNVNVESIKQLGPTLGEGTLDKLKISLVLGVVAANALIIYYFRKRGVLFTVTFALFSVITIALCKFVAMPLSFALIAGFVFSALIYMGILISAEYKIRTAYKGTLTPDELKEIYSKISNKVRNLAIAVLLISYAASTYLFGTVVDGFMIGAGMGFISMVITTIVGFKALLPFLMLKKK